MWNKLQAYLRKQSRIFFILLGIILVLILGIFDYVTQDFFVLDLYIIPVALAAWFSGRKTGIFMAVVAAIGALVVDVIETPVHPSFLVHYWNTFMNLTFFIIAAIFLDFLNKTLEKLRALGELKDSLTMMIIHDLNNPLGTVEMAIELLRRETKGKLPSEESTHFQVGLFALHDLKRMICNLLDITRMEEGKIKLRKEHFALADISGEVIEQMKMSVMSRDKKLTLDAEENVPAVEADKEIIKRVIANLLNNALKFSPDRGTVFLKISFKPQEKSVYVQVSDQGRGIPGEYQERIFNKFFQIEAEGVRTGAGLGLTFCKMMVEAHGGRIWAESGGQDKGTTMTFTLPVTA